ncbi:MAG TPA: 50S ribosomal protein L2 [Candidatus Bipolaricaulis sp.]|nr:50S ribosomal protein L2 [Candidatus Bipolaricaulis sp.]MDY0392860.1 50S ribosomal protein L2 [Candidatus Bipolaricaulis sp.]HPD07137.1 50S ribosomal protein L2 [Candidatus Bipolaricaulis sp.]HRS13593.1 50S ribosomal protein L2 [Candidatus Bipolaricaulis sp.]HRU21977.1 50S ribosomal protein L2 [Candidatus Bipolaricaulis sp.]
MGLKKLKPVTPGQRHAVAPDYGELTRDKPEKGLVAPLARSVGRNNQGRITTRHKGSGHKRRYRWVDFAREKHGVPARVVSVEYDPNRSAWITLLHYRDGEKRYILAPLELRVGDTVEAGESAEPKPGNALPLRRIPAGTFVHNVELYPGSRGKVARAAGTAAQLLGREEDRAILRLPSGEIRVFHLACMATVGRVSNPDHKNVRHGKAGRVRHLGRRPSVRGVAMGADDHPHGGGEGRTGEGRPSKTPWGKLARGVPTRKNKASDAKILKRRE